MKPPAFDSTTRHVAALVKGLPVESHERFPPSFPLTTCTFVERLVSPEVFRAGVAIYYDDYLKGLLAADHFALVLAGQSEVLENLGRIRDEIRKKDSKPMLALDLALVAMGAWAYGLPDDHFRDGDVARRAAARDARPDPAAAARPPDPYYLALGDLLCRQTSGWRRDALGTAPSRQALKAIVFLDAVSGLTDVPGARARLEAGDWLDASVLAAEALRAFSTPDALRERLEPALAGRS